MKVLGVSGTPRPGGNTTILVEEALKAIAGRVETELVALADYGPPGQRRAGALEDVVARIRACDGLILATPSHFGMPGARLKAVLDATWEDAKRGAHEGKPGACMAVESEWGGELACATLAHFFAAHRMPYLGSVVGRGTKEREILHDMKAIREAKALANRVADAVLARRG
ncbi:MAG TPA: NAD(P)H-dependent oxidoreductase [Candidatus Thermoplasmatota archaeon]|nr:NAD(P)H-dependent oxidoreductase [Candidatus Thermoplasmatota archaeon]